MRADGFEDGDDDGEQTFSGRDAALRRPVGAARRYYQTAGENRAVIDETLPAELSRAVAISEPDMFLSKPPNGDEAIHALRAHDGFDGVGDDFAREERVFHCLCAHGNAVGHGDGVEDDGFAAGVVRFGFARELVMLHGVTMPQVEAMPTMGLEKSSGLKPTG